MLDPIFMHYATSIVLGVGVELHGTKHVVHDRACKGWIVVTLRGEIR